MSDTGPPFSAFDSIIWLMLLIRETCGDAAFWAVEAVLLTVVAIVLWKKRSVLIGSAVSRGERS